MANEWQTICPISDQKVGYSDTALREILLRGQSRPQHAADVEREYIRESRAMAIPACHLNALDRSKLIHGPSKSPLGILPYFSPAHSMSRREPSVDVTKFGITEEKLREMYSHFENPKVQVLVAVAPTGSGKSTYLPYSLLVPPKGIQQDFITRRGQIVITQPRIQATRNIPAFVGGVMHGGTLGAGYDVGFRHSGAPMSDWRSKLVYVTDGTLINWIVAGELDKISLIMIDEAHERSLNIDIIIGLLTKVLPRYPHLRLIIASATIDKALFVNHFNNNMRGRAECRLVEFEGKSYGVTANFQPENEALDYGPDNLRDFAREAYIPLADKIVSLLKRMTSGNDFAGEKRGDILGFLQGERPIQNAVARIKDLVAQIPELRDIVDVLPLYTTLPQTEQDLALQEPKDLSRIRVVISTNVAETSLTIHGIKHVVETGLINQTRWESTTQTLHIGAIIHSQAGCRQRWGRAGRLQPGDAWCLYTEKQFNNEQIFPKYSVAEIQRSPLDQVVLTAKLAGIDGLEVGDFPWIEPPPKEELERAIRSLKWKGALDDDGDLTAHGIELQKFGGDVTMAKLMTTADRFACAVEMATLIPMMKIGGHKKLLQFQRDWSPALQRHVRKIHQAMVGGCRDDLEMCLKIYAAWNQAEEGPEIITQSWAWNDVWKQRLPKVPKRICQGLSDNGTNLKKQLSSATRWDDIQQVVETYHAPELSNWIETNVRGAFRRAAKETWANLHYVDESILRPVHQECENQLTALSVRKKEQERRPVNFELLDRVRLIMAWCLKENCFIHERSAKDNEHPTYRSLVSFPEADANTEDTFLVEIGNDSVCCNRPLSGFVCGERRTMRRVPYAGAEPQQILLASFIVEINDSTLEHLKDCSMSDLVRLIAEGESTRGQIDPRPATNYQRLFIDQSFPLFSQVQYRSAGPINSNPAIVDIAKLEKLPWHSAGTAPQVANKPAPPEAFEANESDVDLLDNPDKLSQKIQIDGVRMFAAVDSDEILGEVGDDDSEDGSVVFETSHPIITPQGKLTTLSGTWPETTGIAEVRGYDWTAEGPVLLLSNPTKSQSFQQFSDKYRVGRKVSVKAIDYEGFPGDTREGLRVREKVTNLEIVMEPEHVSFSQAGHVVRGIPLGTEFDAEIQSIDTSSQTVELSTLPLAEDLLTALDSVAQKKAVNGYVRFVNERNIFLHLEQSRPDRGIILTVSIRTDSDQTGPTTYDQGFKVPVVLRYKPSTKEQLTTEPPKFNNIRKVLQSHQVLWDAQSKQLSHKGRMPHATYRTLISKIADPEVQRAITWLYRKSNTPLAEVADPDLAQKYPVGKTVELKISYVEADWARAQLPSGGNARFQRNGMPKGKSFKIGAVVTARVINCDIGRQEVQVSTRRNFTTSLALNQQHRGKLIGPKGAKLREIEDATEVEIEILEKEPRVRIYGPTMSSIDDARKRIRKVVPRNCWGTVTIDSDEMKHLIGSGGSNVKRIREASNVDIDIDKKDNRTVTVYASTHHQLEGVLKAIQHHHSGNAPSFTQTPLEPVQEWLPQHLQPAEPRKPTVVTNHTPWMERLLSFANFFAFYTDYRRVTTPVHWIDEEEWYNPLKSKIVDLSYSKNEFWKVMDHAVLGCGNILMALGILLLVLGGIALFFTEIAWEIASAMGVPGGIGALAYGLTTALLISVGKTGIRQFALLVSISAFSLIGLACGVVTIWHFASWYFFEGTIDLMLAVWIVGAISGLAISGFFAAILNSVSIASVTEMPGYSATNYYPSSPSRYRSRSYDDWDDEDDDYY